MRPFVEELQPVPDPARCCELLEGLPHRVFLDSAAGGSRLGRYSFLSADPVTVVRSTGDSAALESVRALLAPHATAPIDGLPPFQGGAAGYLSYDWGRALEALPATRYDDLRVPDVVVGIYDWVLAWDHEASRAWLISTGMPETSPEAKEGRAKERATEVRGRLGSDPGDGATQGLGVGVLLSGQLAGRAPFCEASSQVVPNPTVTGHLDQTGLVSRRQPTVKRQG
jgi:para-aminobenzoate synthetase component 1